MCKYFAKLNIFFVTKYPFACKLCFISSFRYNILSIMAMNRVQNVLAYGAKCLYKMCIQCNKWL